MRDFGTFDKLTDEEDTIYSRLAVIKRELTHLGLEQNEAQQDIKMWYNKINDDKFKLKIWLVITLIVGIGALPWYLIILKAIPPGLDYSYVYILNIIATFLYLVQTFVFLPLFLIFVVVFLVKSVLFVLRNIKNEGIMKLANLIGVDNRHMLIAEQKVIVGGKARQIEILKAEEEKLQQRLESIGREKRT